LVKYGPYGRLNGTRKSFTDRVASDLSRVDVYKGSFRGNENVIVGIQLFYNGAAAGLHGRITEELESITVGPIRKITIWSLEEGLPRPNKLVNGLEFTVGKRKIFIGSRRGKKDVIPKVRDNVIPRQDNDNPGGYHLQFISGYTTTDTPEPMIGQINFFFLED